MESQIRGNKAGPPTRLFNGTRISLLVLSLFVPVALAVAHTGEDVAGGLISGLVHPFSGLDHVVAMIAVGLWGAQLGMPAIWLLPVTFPLAMAVGGMLGVAGVVFPGIETGIALSAIVLGVMVLLAVRPPLFAAAAIVGFFAVFHGFAHGLELPASANPLSYSAGFVAATGSLHAVGIVIGTLIRWPAGAGIIRVGGAIVLAVGVYFLLRSLGM